MRTRNGTLPAILALALFLSACAGPLLRIKVATDCDWTRDLNPPDQVLDWIATLDGTKGTAASAETWQYLDRVAKHNELWAENCG